MFKFYCYYDHNYYLRRRPFVLSGQKCRMDIINIVGITITILSFIYAIYTNRRHAKLIDFNREKAWDMYRQTSEVLAIFQTLESLKKISDLESVALVAKGEAQAKELTHNSIKMIKRFENKFDTKTIDNWNSTKKLTHHSHVDAFKHLI